MSWFSKNIIRPKDLDKAITEVGIHMMKEDIGKIQRTLNNLGFCDAENCGAIYQLQDFQAVEQIEYFLSTPENVGQSILHFCRKHRRPYDRIEITYSPSGANSVTRLFKTMVEVDNKGKIINKK